MTIFVSVLAQQEAEAQRIVAEKAARGGKKDRRPGPVLNDAEEQARGAMDATAEGQAATGAGKAAYAREGPVLGPGPSDILWPSRHPATDFGRPYIEAGHAAAPPGHEGPNEAPVTVAAPGTVTTADPGALPPQVDLSGSTAVGWEVRPLGPPLHGRTPC